MPLSSPPTPSQAVVTLEATQPPHKRRKLTRILVITGLVVLFVTSLAGAYFFGKHGQKVIVRAPTPPPITLPPQAIVTSECTPGLGKQYVLPKNIPNGPIYGVKNSRVITVEYNYKAVDLFISPNRLSDTIIPLTKNYQIDHFTTSIGELKGGSKDEAQQVPIQLVMYVVPQAEADAITCKK